MRRLSLFLLVFPVLFSFQTLPAAESTAPSTVVVLSSGEPLLAGSVEAYVEKQLAKLGFDVVDESGVPGLHAWLDGHVSQEEENRILDTLARRADHLIVIEASYLGERPLYYLYRTEPIFQARLKIRTIPFEVDALPHLLLDENMEFTHLSLDRAIEKTLGKKIKDIAAGLDAAQSGQHE